MVDFIHARARRRLAKVRKAPEFLTDKDSHDLQGQLFNEIWKMLQASFLGLVTQRQDCDAFLSLYDPSIKPKAFAALWQEWRARA